ncbi:uncharacterized protein LOC111723819 [Otolemur garnettii]|uniref:uncharacterized protein LOC111723819 n=1 Tax=Otolemur garnettii TaxID=30611 RepID=UPI000C7F552B|nr:uncharacterized protein LOC111723819 [Otolemur garnettii]
MNHWHKAPIEEENRAIQEMEKNLEHLEENYEGQRIDIQKGGGERLGQMLMRGLERRRGPGRAGGRWGGGGGGGGCRRRARTNRRPQQQQRQSPESCEAPLPAQLSAPRRARTEREPPSATALRTLAPILALLLRLLHLGLGSGGCREDVPPSGRGKKEEKMKKYRRALALVSCLSLCSLVWLPSWRVCCKESSSASASSYYSQDDNCALENEDVQFQKKVP